ncbi:hypothetical protein GIB67_001329 [Kingdonia uniflora]|uniref:Uncharacterized protein n=1 Tax=Kingdonia uniflora TaxID=39325 RepID=A0A7J7LL44_9MAGN|nr:hypothetical protein GIB67_001329 [Kingdonia uniflora]
MVKTLSKRAVEARALNDLRLAFKIDEIREAIFGRQGYDAVLLETQANYEGGKDKRKEVTRSLYYKQREKAEIEEVLKKLQELSKLVRTNAVDSHSGVEAQFDYGLMLPLSNLAKSVMNMIGACPAQLNCNFWEVILVCETLNERWAASGSERRITFKNFLKYYAVKYVTATDGAYLSSSSSRPFFFNLSSAGRVWNENLLWVSGISCKVLRKESFIDVVAREGTELEAVLKELEISRLKRVASKDDKVRRSQAKRRMAGITPGTMEEKLLTPELNTLLKLAQLNEMPDGPVDIATVSSTVVRNFAKRKAVVLEESDKIAKGTDLRPRFKVEAGLLEEQCRAKAREKMVVVVDDEFNMFARALRGVQLGHQDRSIELEKRISQLEGEKNRAESVAEAERLVTASATSRNNYARKLYQLRYTKVEIFAFSEGNYEEKEIMDEEEVEEMDDGLNVDKKTAANNQEHIDQEIENSRLRVVDLEGLLKVEKKSSAELQKELGVAREREEQTLLYNAEYAEEYEALISQYEDRLDDNVKLSLKLKEVKSQVEDMTAIILSRDLALNELTRELAELKEKAASGSRHKAELAKYRIRALNDKISDMKCNIHALNEQLLKNEIDLDTARTDLAVSEDDFEKLNSSIAAEDLELRNSAQIRDSLIARLDRLKANLHRLKGREAQSRADLVEVQAKNKSLVDNLAHAHGNVRRVVQRDKEMNERINQLCARISELERELRVRELKYEKDLKFELDKRDGEIASGEGSREMKEFLH